MNILHRLHLFICRLILFLLGWRTSIPDNLYEAMDKNTKLVAIYPHTSYWDFMLMMLYWPIFPVSARKRLVALMKPQPFELLGGFVGKFLRNLGCIPAPRVEDRNSRALESLIQLLGERDEFFFLISPKGKRDKAEWRSGYRIVAEQLGASILVLGANYQTKEIMYGDVIDPTNQEYRGLQHPYFHNRIKAIMSPMIPLHPDRSDCELDKYDPDFIGIMSVERKFDYMFAMFMTLVIATYSFFLLHMLDITA